MAGRIARQTHDRAQCLGYRQAQIFQYIRNVVRDDGIAPTYSMIADQFGMAQPDVCQVVKRLEGRGLLCRLSVTGRKSMGWHKPVITLAKNTNYPTA